MFSELLRDKFAEQELSSEIIQQIFSIWVTTEERKSEAACGQGHEQIKKKKKGGQFIK